MKLDHHANTDKFIQTGKSGADITSLVEAPPNSPASILTQVKSMTMMEEVISTHHAADMRKRELLAFEMLQWGHLITFVC